MYLVGLLWVFLYVCVFVVAVTVVAVTIPLLWLFSSSVFRWGEGGGGVSLFVQTYFVSEYELACCNQL